jgi:DNA (cytosine-5)-methyltransferase 1
MAAYYNEHDPFAAAWLRELIKDGHTAPGEVDTRSIEDVHPSDLRGFAQCHFFAGIGVWSLALRQAGWADDRPIWTGSCPCQPFSAAGKGGGFADERHIWPAFFHLIQQCAPDIVAGEQVASKDGLAWLDLVQADLEGADYAVGAVDTCAAGFGAPHIRQRLYWVGTRLEHAAGDGRVEWRPEPGGRSAASGCGDGRMAYADGEVQGGRRILGPGEGAGPRSRTARERPARLRQADGFCGLADAESARRANGATLDGGCGSVHAAATEIIGVGDRGASSIERPGPTNGLWAAADWLGCRDGKWRPVEPGTFPLAHAGAFRNRVGELRGAGNALNLAQATGFIEAVLEALA